MINLIMYATCTMVYCIKYFLQNMFSGLIDLAIRRNSLIGGDDFKSGQTKMKSVLVDFLVGAGIKVSFDLSRSFD